MILKKFSVNNYKIFKDEFSIDLYKGSEEILDNYYFTILTGKNNMGKSTFLEAISELFKKDSKNLTIKESCYNNKNKDIILKSIFILDETKDADLIDYLKIKNLINGNYNSFELHVMKSYQFEKAANFKFKIKDINQNAIDVTSKDDINRIKEYIYNHEPYYIRPNMTVEEIDNLVNIIYTDAIITKSQEDAEKLQVINDDIRGFINAFKQATDKVLNEVENDISEVLNRLFTGQNFSIKITGSQSSFLSITDILKTMKTDLRVNNTNRSDMLLSEQGTGVQRISLIYTIQKIIEKGIGNLGGRMLLVDEPEAFLHPEAIRALSDSLYSIGDSMPIIITTHSPILINLEKDHTIIDIFRIDKDNQEAIALYNSENSKFDANDKENRKILNYIDPYINEFFFSDHNIIVEGTTEKMILKFLQKEHNLNFHIIEARGKATIVTLMKILNQFNSKYYVLHDLDNHVSGISQKRAQRTNCLNIFHQKQDICNIYALENTFEHVFYNHTVSSSQKVAKIYSILSSKDPSDSNYVIKNDIINTFSAIFELDIKCEGSPNDKCYPINSIDDILSKFDIPKEV
ncbi:ATP-dependent nuclease [Macrococcus bovicus]|uniref:ATP-dependent nuclease n=1 Tax=Macrococcus bovicus TaxID=69968 RepID=UPI0025A59EEF|nr:AAA family ATPase [Macrococcus bovicus]WJP97265.1 AAA family ATPase [Macrococcus bovicus]